MENLFYNISQVLGITVVHSLWQGLIVYMLLRIFMLVLPQVHAAFKYRVAFGALTAVLGWFLYTLFLQLINYEWQSSQPVAVNILALPGLISASDAAPTNKYFVTIAGYMPYVTVLYVVGLVFNTLKLAFAWNNIYQIRKYVTQTEFAASIRKLSTQLNLKTKVDAAFSEWVDVPCVTGFFKPIILLPISISCYLNTEEVEAILLHELAHVKRNDYLHNFIQQVIGVMLFFNPFARLISKVISEEREHSCDDLVIETTSRPFIYAQTLLKLEENKQYQWQLALAATGKRKFELLNRIERIMKTKKHTINIRPVLVTVLALTFGITSIAWLNPKVEDGKLKVKNLDPTIKMLTAFASGGDIAAAEPIAVNIPAPAKIKKPRIEVLYDDTTLTDLRDTIGKPKKYNKIIIVDENGNRKEYNSVADLPADFKQDIKTDGFKFDFRYDNDSAFVKMDNYFESSAWKKQMAAVEKHAAELEKRFSSPEWKKKQANMEKQALAMTKRFEGKDWKKNLADIERQAAALEKHFDSPEWKKKQADIEQQAEELGKKFESDEWKDRQNELTAKAMELGSEAADISTKMMASPEWKQYMDELTKTMRGPEWKKQQEGMVKMMASPEWKKYLQEVDKVQQKVVERTIQSVKRVKDRPAIKKIVEKEIELKELPELPEKPEAAEKPELPEKPEVAEKPNLKEVSKAKKVSVKPAAKPVTPAKPL